jgi:hypothetical protein
MYRYYQYDVPIFIDESRGGIQTPEFSFTCTIWIHRQFNAREILWTAKSGLNLPPGNNWVFDEAMDGLRWTWVTLFESRSIFLWLPFVFLTNTSYTLHWLTLDSIENLSTIVGSSVTTNRCRARTLHLFLTAATSRRKCDRAAKRVRFMCQTWRTASDQIRLNVTATR